MLNICNTFIVLNAERDFHDFFLLKNSEKNVTISTHRLIYFTFYFYKYSIWVYLIFEMGHKCLESSNLLNKKDKMSQ